MEGKNSQGERANIFEILILVDEKRKVVMRDTTALAAGLVILMNDNIFPGSP